MGISFVCRPTDHANAIVHRYVGEDVAAATNDETSFVEVTLSRTNSSPGKNGSDEFLRRYRLFRIAELVQSNCTATEFTLLPESLLISRACSRITGRAKRRDMRDRLEALVKQLDEEEQANENDAVDGLQDILRRAVISDEVTERLAGAIVTDERYRPEIEKAVTQQVTLEVQKRREQIEEEAGKRASEAMTTVDEVEKHLDALKKTRDQLEIDILQLKENNDREESRISAIVDSAHHKLTEGRQELLAELSLLGPLLQSYPSGNGSTTVQSTRTVASTSSCVERFQCEGEAIDEPAFSRHWLPQSLHNHGCEIRDSHSELFHALVVACPLIAVPHLGWAAGYCEAMGVSAEMTPISVEPDYLSFRDIDNGPIGRAWRRAIENPDRLFLITLDGIDRSPSHAWFRPWINIVAGWSTTLPSDDDLTWPDNVRLFVTEEKSEACFALPDDLRKWIVEFRSESEGGTMASAITVKNRGYLPLEVWRHDASRSWNDEHDALCKEIELDLCNKFAPMRRRLANRLYSVLVRLGRENDRIPRAIQWLLREWTSTNEDLS